jgi:carboxylesterase
VEAPPPPTEPFFWPAGPVGCLLLHGFTSTPYEMRFLGERLAAAGHTVAAVRLAGHGTRAEDLERSGWRDWYASAQAGADEIAAHCTRVVTIGLSMGALLALHLAHDRPSQVGGIVLLSSALRLANRWSWLTSGLRPFTPLLPERVRFVRKLGSDIADPDARRIQPGYGRIPIRSVAELAALQRRVRRLLPRIVQPAFAVHAKQDHTAPLANVDLLGRRLPNLREVVLLDESFHVISVDVEREHVASHVVRFVNGLAAGD